MYQYMSEKSEWKGGKLILSVAEAIGLLLTFGIFIIKLLDYVDKRDKK